ncbi:hypothetical protein HRI_005298300 [Hibiscus trionum]|uniref:Uncharacterized protein n=1 Tax=Hibiscus trionum TaxID=183268 RepID=A0A9W7JIP4_HIBTR|nr:hypothetical protein HRI_004773800 [Hibiscus trionum]GMJ16096.1 hypothetical protein HRI_005278800 [Hibiscus trionum]GMJ16177.1 hypothetical protein HRI_005286900 [Hibiscus trionum]GMJ16192.1 hypothetical protein HRI_005288400 [Hibiscus trionum]GMJ16278.1 hypothetical protein HRI_005297000 [Hibiscus trionum]
MTTRRAQVIHRSDETLKAAFSSVSSGTFCQSGKVFGDNTWRYQKAAVRWVHESDEVALTTEPCLSVGANWMIGPRAAPSSPHSPFPNMNLESSKPF